MTNMCFKTFHGDMLLCVLLTMVFVMARTFNCNLDALYESGHKLNSSTYYYKTKSSLYSCAAECKRQSICQSVNFNTKSKVCYLNYDTSTQIPLYDVSDPDYMYSSVSGWPDSIVGPCAKHECKMSEMCLVQRNYDTVCNPLLMYDFENEIEYEIFVKKREWSEALNLCYSRGGHLAQTETIGEYNLLKAYMTAVGFARKYVFLGATDEEIEDVWRWEDGSPFTPTMWAQGQPQRQTSQNCLAVRFTDGWHDFPCSASQYYVCERQKKFVV